MILKLGTIKGWIITEVDSVEYYKIKSKDIPYTVDECPTQRIGHKVSENHFEMIILLYRKNRMIQRIITTADSYLCSDEGKTIEKIS